MHHRNLLGYLHAPGHDGRGHHSGLLPRASLPKPELPPSAMKEALSYKAPFGDTRTAPARNRRSG